MADKIINILLESQDKKSIIKNQLSIIYLHMQKYYYQRYHQSRSWIGSIDSCLKKYRTNEI